MSSFAALAPDLYHGPVAATIEKAQALMKTADDLAMGETGMAAKDFLLAHPRPYREKLGAVGFSMGSGGALMA